MTIQVKAVEQYCPEVLFITLYNATLPFDSVNETLTRENANGSY